MNKKLYIYKNDTDYIGRDGRNHTGTRWIVKDESDRFIDTFKTRKDALETIDCNFDPDTTTIHFGMPGA